MIRFNLQWTPRRGRILRVIALARISTVNQDECSLDDQIALLKEYVKSLYDGPIEWEIIKSTGSGEYLDREELRRAEDLVESRRFDLFIVEDLARLCRGTKAYEFCEICQDAETRRFEPLEGFGE